MASVATARRMTALVRQWETSGERKAAFVQQHDASLGTFEYWKRRVRETAATKVDAVGFAPVRIVSTTDALEPQPIIVVLATGERLIVPPGAAADQCAPSCRRCGPDAHDVSGRADLCGVGRDRSPAIDRRTFGGGARAVRP